MNFSDRADFINIFDRLVQEEIGPGNADIELFKKLRGGKVKEQYEEEETVPVKTPFKVPAPTKTPKRPEKPRSPIKPEPGVHPEPKG